MPRKRYFVVLQPMFADEQRLLEAYEALETPRRRSTWVRGLLKVGFLGASMGAARGALAAPQVDGRRSKKKAPMTIPVHLDRHYSLEARILVMYEALGSVRGKQWLHELLLEGFRLEQRGGREPAVAAAPATVVSEAGEAAGEVAVSADEPVEASGEAAATRAAEPPAPAVLAPVTPSAPEPEPSPAPTLPTVEPAPVAQPSTRELLSGLVGLSR